MARSRKPGADSAGAVLSRTRKEYTGTLCEDVLPDSGVTDLSVYDRVPGPNGCGFQHSPELPGYVQR